jgi:hypothetical protein
MLIPQIEKIFMSKFTIIVEEKRLEKLVLSVLNVLKSIPQIHITQSGGTFVIRSQQKGKEKEGTNGDPNLASHFENLFQKWKSETLLSSSGSEILEHPAYHHIIELGEAIVPFILIKLKEDPHHLFYALFKITGENPIQSNHVGNLSQMAGDWINWGLRKGYLN